MAYIGRSPADAALTSADIADGSVTNPKLAGSISNNKLLPLANSTLENNSVTYNTVAVALGASGTISTTETQPVFTSADVSVITNAQSTIVITGQNFTSIPNVVLVNNSTGQRFTADETAFNSNTQLTCKFTISLDGVYFYFIQNPDGEAGISGSTALTVSDLPAWQTAAGSLGTFAAGSDVGTISITATDAASFARTSGNLPGGLTLNSAATTATITGIESGATSATQFSFTITATDAEGQTSPQAFTIDISVGATGSTQFN